MDPVTAALLLTLAFGVGAVFGLMVNLDYRGRDTFQPVAAVSEPTRHVVPVRIGDCAMCGKKNVRVHLLRPHDLLDPEDHCDGCAKTAVDA